MAASLTSFSLLVLCAFASLVVQCFACCVFATPEKLQELEGMKARADL